MLQLLWRQVLVGMTQRILLLCMCCKVKNVRIGKLLKIDPVI